MLASLITRVLQLIFAVIVLGLSVRAAKWQWSGSVPASTAYAAFAGGFAVLITLVGIAAIWISAIPALIMSMVDALAAVLLLAGGIVSPSHRLCTSEMVANNTTRLTRSRSLLSIAATEKPRPHQLLALS